MNSKCPYDFDRTLFKKLIGQTNVAYEELAPKIGISVPALIQYLNGKATPTIVSLLKISDYFQVPIDILMCRHTPEDYDELLKGNAEFMFKCRKAAFEDYLVRKKARGTVIDEALEHKEVYYATYPYNLVEVIFGEPVDELITENQLAGLEMAIETLSPREQKMVKLYFEDEKTLQEIGKIFNLTMSRIQQIVTKAIRKLRTPTRVKMIKNGPRYKDIQDLDEAEAAIAERTERIAKQLAELENMENQLKEKTENTLQMPFTKTLFDTIDSLDLSVRSYNGLIRSNCTTVNQVVELLENGDIFKVRNLGKKSVEEIITKINKMYGVCFSPILSARGSVVSYECV